MKSFAVLHCWETKAPLQKTNKSFLISQSFSDQSNESQSQAKNKS